MRKLVLLVIVSLVFCFISCNQNVNDESEKDLVFVSFNIRLGSEWSRGQDSLNYWDYRREAVLRMIQEESPDAIGMQEVLPNQLHYLDSALVDYCRIGVGREDGKEEGECMSIFFKKDVFELLKSQTYWLSETPDSVSMGWDAACFRTVTMALLKQKGSQREILYMNTHLDHVGTTARAESTKLLAKLAQEWSVNAMPILIGGDMNTSSDDTIFNNILTNGFQKAREKALISDNEITYNAFGKEPPKQIDHYFSKNLNIKEFHTLNGDYGVPYISDHYPIKIVVSLPK